MIEKTDVVPTHSLSVKLSLYGPTALITISHRTGTETGRNEVVGGVFFLGGGAEPCSLVQGPYAHVFSV